MAKRANREGSIYHDKVYNIYKASVTLTSGKRIYKSSKERQVVADWLADTLSSVNKGSFVAPNKWTVKIWRDEWLDTYVKPKCRQKTYEDYEAIIKNITLPFEEKPLQSITSDDIYRQLLQRAGAGRSDGTIKKDATVTSRMFKQAYTRRLIPFNPCDFVEIPKGAGVVRPPRVGKKEDIQIFLKAAKNDSDPNTYPAILALFSNGLRRSELLGLQWGDFDFEADTFQIQRALISVKGGNLRIEEPKTKSGKRTMAMSADVKEALLELRKKRKLSPWVFADSQGDPLKPRFFSSIFARIEKASGVSISLHGARHSTATILAEANISGSDLAGFLGHSDASFSMKRYVHPTREANRQAQAMISDALNPQK